MADTNTKNLEAVRHIEDDRQSQTDAKVVREELVHDNDAAGYVDSTIQISPDEDKRLRRKVWRQ